MRTTIAMIFLAIPLLCRAGDSIPFKMIHYAVVQVSTSTELSGFRQVSRDTFVAVAKDKAEQVEEKTIYLCSVNYSGQLLHRLSVQDGVLIAEVNKYAAPHGHPPKPEEGKTYRYDMYIITDSPIAFKEAEVKYITVTPN